MAESPCAFCEIARSKDGIVASNRAVFVVEDANPKAKTHLLVVPWTHVERLDAAEPALVIAIHWMIRKLAHERGLEGYRVVVNVGEAGKQTVPHLHFHMLAGPEVVEPGFARSVA